jgi:hypothetical protein
VLSSEANLNGLDKAVSQKFDALSWRPDGQTVYTKKIRLPILRRLVNSISIAADLGHLRYSGVRGKAAPDRDRALARFTSLAERVMEKKRR